MIKVKPKTQPKKAKTVIKDGKITVHMIYEERPKPLNLVKWLMVVGIILFTILIALVAYYAPKNDDMCLAGGVPVLCSEFVNQ